MLPSKSLTFQEVFAVIVGFPNAAVVCGERDSRRVNPANEAGKRTRQTNPANEAGNEASKRIPQS